jgi:hypothetical protein
MHDVILRIKLLNCACTANIEFLTENEFIICVILSFLTFNVKSSVYMLVSTKCFRTPIIRDVSEGPEIFKDILISNNEISNIYFKYLRSCNRIVQGQ